MKKVFLVVLSIVVLIMGGLLSGCFVAPQPQIIYVPTPAPAPTPAPSNQAPVVNAGPAQECWTGGAVVLQGSASDPDGDQLFYSWSCRGGSLSSYTILNPTFYAPTTVDDYICTLTVSDGRGGSTQAYTTVRVRQRYQDCYTVVTVSVYPKFVCIGSPVTISGTVSVSYGRCNTDPAVELYIDGQRVGTAYTDTYGNFTFIHYYTNALYPRTHTVKAVAQYNCCRQGSATDYFEASTCGRPCGCGVCPCPQPYYPPPCPCPVCPCPPPDCPNCPHGGPGLDPD